MLKNKKKTVNQEFYVQSIGPSNIKAIKMIFLD